MNARALRRMVVIAGLDLALGVAPAWAGRGRGPRGPAAGGPAGRGARPDRRGPGGRRDRAGRALDRGLGGGRGYIDPNGLRATGPPGCAAGGGLPGRERGRG